MKKKKYSLIVGDGSGRDNCSVAARKYFESIGMVDGLINSTRISLILRAKEYETARVFNKVYKELYPLLTKNGQKMCDEMLKNIKNGQKSLNE